MKIDKKVVSNRYLSIFQSIVSILSILLIRWKYEKLERNTSLLLNSMFCNPPNTIIKQNDLKSVMKEFNFI